MIIITSSGTPINSSISIFPQLNINNITVNDVLSKMKDSATSGPNQIPYFLILNQLLMEHRLIQVRRILAKRLTSMIMV
ncbi:hypothetical protein BDFB_012455 [Asbolus verrucosus]|uniref:Uncharacterized protein n=1 Tax=Asbolus verrucosus TaxID=1661398 RepID=A0A482VTU0_ASBVE|nr:hypothetical protein BDFB_012455 [Asbolus verrucosus]